MAWNHSAQILAMAIAIQPTPGTFVQPNTTTDLIAVSVPTNGFEGIFADDPTATGTIFRNRRVYLGKTGSAGASLALRGPGGAAPPVANAWVPGRVFQSAGFAEVILPTATNAVTVAGSTTTAINLAATESAVDGFLFGAPVQQAQIGTGFKATSLIQRYVGTGRIATLAETMAVAPSTGAAYTLPAHVRYVAGGLTSAPPLLSISVWRGKKRYDYSDWRPSSLNFDVPVANEANSNFPSCDFTGKGDHVQTVTETAPVVPSSLLSNIPPARNGKFFLDRKLLGHQSFKTGLAIEVGAPSNQNAQRGQDGYEILSATRTIELDLNQMDVTDYNIDAAVDNQTIIPLLSTWGIGAGNNFGIVVSQMVLDPYEPGDRNGFVNLTGNGHYVDNDKWMALSIWW
jgi:hypothetical protein